MKWFTLVLALCLVSGRPFAMQESVASALDLYSRGSVEAAIARVPLDTISVDSLLAAGDKWIADGDPAGLSQRTLMAASFGLDVLWATRGKRFEYSGGPHMFTMSSTMLLKHSPAALMIVGWGCERLSTLDISAARTRWWWLSSVALLEDQHDWAGLMGWVGVTDWKDTSPAIQTLLEREMKDGHLSHARRHVADDPRLQLAAALAVVERFDAGLYERPTRADVLANIEAWQTQRGPAHFDEMLHALDAVAADPQVGGEADIRIGFLEMRRQHWAPALARFEHARDRVDEPMLKAAVEYFSGWVYERTHRIDDAIAAYRRADAALPHLRNVSMLLAADLYQTNHRADAYAVLDGLMQTRKVPPDPLTTLRDADARFLPDWLPRMREALR